MGKVDPPGTSHHQLSKKERKKDRIRRFRVREGLDKGEEREGGKTRKGGR